MGCCSQRRREVLVFQLLRVSIECDTLSIHFSFFFKEGGWAYFAFRSEVYAPDNPLPVEWAKRQAVPMDLKPVSQLSRG